MNGPEIQDWRVLELVLNFAVLIPFFLVFGVGVILALVRRGVPTAARWLVVIALLLLTLHSGVGAVIWTYVPRMVYESLRTDPETARWIFVAIRIVQHTIDAVLLGMLILAALAVRRQETPYSSRPRQNEDISRPHIDRQGAVGSEAIRE